MLNTGLYVFFFRVPYGNLISCLNVLDMVDFLAGSALIRGSTGLRFICSKVTSYKIHILVNYLFLILSKTISISNIELNFQNVNYELWSLVIRKKYRYVHCTFMSVGSWVSAGIQRKWEQKLINSNDAMPYCSFPPAPLPPPSSYM